MEGGVKNMTAQINDTFIFENVEYSLISASHSFGIKPMEYGITPQYIETSCWRGYWNEYGLQNNQVVLKNIFVNSAHNRYPKIVGKRPCLFLRENGYHKYKDLNIELNYTGQLLIARKYLWECRYDACFDEPWEYEVLIKLIFKNGLLSTTENYYDIAQQTREFLLENPEKRHMFFRYEFLKKLYDSG